MRVKAGVLWKKKTEKIVRVSAVDLRNYEQKFTKDQLHTFEVSSERWLGEGDVRT